MLMPILALCGDAEGGSPLELDLKEDADLLPGPELIRACVAGIDEFWTSAAGGPRRALAGQRV